MASVRQLVKTGLFSLIVPGVVAGVIPRLLAHRDRIPFPISGRAVKPFGGISVVTGVLLYLHTAWRFSDEGDGTPATIDEPERLVTGGIYARVRNPMYVAVLLCILGQAFIYRSVHVLWWAVGCTLGFHNQVTGFEEPHLREKHGETYEEYCERVPRWLPRLRWKGSAGGEPVVSDGNGGR